MSFENAAILIAGGTGAVGSGLVRHALSRGARVVVPSRTQEKLDALAASVADVSTGTLIPIVGSLDTPDSVNAVRDAAWKAVKDLDVVIAAIGGWAQGQPITGVTFDVWERLVRENLTSHYLAMKAFTAVLRPGTGAYVHINGFGAETVVPGAGPVTAMAAAQKSLALTLAAELKVTGLRVYEIILGPVNTAARVQSGHSKPEWLTPEEIGAKIETLIDSKSEDVLHRWLRRNA
jgi:NAD(P)-dependent dehydrogenase (short-subunit alcohol dehydrogenase family)